VTPRTIKDGRRDVLGAGHGRPRRAQHAVRPGLHAQAHAGLDQHLLPRQRRVRPVRHRPGPSVATHTAVAHARTHDQRNFEAALASRDLIDQARGILRERHTSTAERAFGVLVSASQQSNVTLVEVARRVIDTGVSPPIAKR
jgi:AmiR/NasT family two-component response regulator